MIRRSVIWLITITEREISENMKTEKTLKILHSSDGKERIQTMLGPDPEIRRSLIDSVNNFSVFWVVHYKCSTMFSDVNNRLARMNPTLHRFQSFYALNKTI